MRKSPAKNEEVGDFLAHIKKKQYFCSGIEMVAYAALQGTGPMPTCFEAPLPRNNAPSEHICSPRKG